MSYKRFPPLQEAASYNLDETLTKVKKLGGSPSD